MSVLKDTTDIVTAVAGTVTAVAAIITACVAIPSLNTWKKQMKGTADYELARRYLRAVYKIRDAIKFVRNPFIPGAEIVKAMKEAGKEGETVDGGEVSKVVYTERWKKVVEAGTDLDVELREAEVCWGRSAVDVEEDLESRVQELFVMLKMHIEHDQALERDLIYDYDNSNYTKRFKEAVEKIEKYLEPHLNRNSPPKI